MAGLDDYLGGITAGIGGGTSSPTSTSPLGAGSYVDVGNDNGRGPGTAGGRGTGSTGAGYSGIGSGMAAGATGVPISGAGYTEEDIAKILKGMPPEKVAELQRKMQGIGLLPESYKSWGFVEGTMRSGFAELLEASNDRGTTYSVMLDSLLGSGAGKDAMDLERMDRARKRSALEASFNTRLNTYEASDPASVRQTAEQAFQQALGRKPTKDEQAKFLGAFLGRERGAQDAVFDVQEDMDRADRSRALQSFDAETAASGVGGESGSEAQILEQRLAKMLADSPYEIKMGKKTRSYEEQVRLYNNYKSGKGPLAAKPGTSKHGDGRANDLQYSSDKARQWALANAKRYGLHFPIYNPKLGRSKDESWHIEVLGGKGAGHSQGDGHDHAAMTAGAPGPAPLSRDVTVQRQDMGAQAVEFARNENPVETAAYDIGGQFESFLNIINRSVTS